MALPPIHLNADYKPSTENFSLSILISCDSFKIMRRGKINKYKVIRIFLFWELLFQFKNMPFIYHPFFPNVSLYLYLNPLVHSRNRVFIFMFV